MDHFTCEEQAQSCTTCRFQGSMPQWRRTDPLIAPRAKPLNVANLNPVPKMISRVLTCLGGRLSWKSQFVTISTSFFSHVQQANRDANKNLIPLTPLRPAGNTKVSAHLSRNFSILGGGDSFDRIPARRGQRVCLLGGFTQQDLMKHWCFDSFGCSSTKGDDNLLCHGTFSLHSMINLSKPAFAFGIAITSRNSFLLAHAVWTKYKQYKNISILQIQTMWRICIWRSKNLCLPFCKPVLIPNGFKTK